MRELLLSRDTFDNERKFRVEGVRGDVSLERDYHKRGDGIYWGLQAGTMLKAHYTAEDIAHSDRMRKFDPIKKGEVVLIDGKQYRARVLGNYSDCVIFDELKETDENG